MRRLVGLAAIGFTLGGSLWGGRVAQACSFAGSKVHVINTVKHPTDHAAPELETPSVAVSRGRGRGLLGCSGGSTCDDFGFIQLTLPATDAESGADEIGFRITKIAGTLPFDLEALPTDVLRRANGGITIAWYDAPEVDQEPFDFTVEIVAIDLAGNESAPQTLRIADGGDEGCRVAGSGRLPGEGGTVVVLLVALAALRAHRRPRPVGTR